MQVNACNLEIYRASHNSEIFFLAVTAGFDHCKSKLVI